MFGNFFSGNNGGDNQAPTPTPISNTTPAAPPTAPPVNPINGNPPLQNPPTPHAPQQAPNTYTLADLVAGTSQTVSSMTPEDYALQMINGIMNSPAPAETDNSPLGINVNAMRDHFSKIDMTNGIDMTALFTALQQQPDQAPAAMQQILNAQSLNVMTAMVPLINQLVARAQEEATARAVQQTDHNITSASLITAFGDRFAYARNPAVMKLVEGFAETLVKHAPRGTSTAQLVANLDRIFRGMSFGQQSEQQFNDAGMPVQTDMSGIFSRKG